MLFMRSAAIHSMFLHAVSCFMIFMIFMLLPTTWPQDTIQELVAPDGVVVRRVFSRK